MCDSISNGYVASLNRRRPLPMRLVRPSLWRTIQHAVDHAPTAAREPVDPYHHPVNVAMACLENRLLLIERRPVYVLIQRKFSGQKPFEDVRY